VSPLGRPNGLHDITGGKPESPRLRVAERFREYLNMLPSPLGTPPRGARPFVSLRGSRFLLLVYWFADPRTRAAEAKPFANRLIVRTPHPLVSGTSHFSERRQLL
jgi:hypothetical protein